MTLATSTNVGVGTTSPSAGLAITSSGTGNGRAFAIADSSNAEKLTFTDNGNLGIGQTAPSYNLDVSGLGHFTGLVDANFVATSTNATTTLSGMLAVGVNALNVLGNGNVGVGTSTPLYPLRPRRCLGRRFHPFQGNPTVNLFRDIACDRPDGNNSRRYVRSKQLVHPLFRGILKQNLAVAMGPIRGLPEDIKLLSESEHGLHAVFPQQHQM